MVAIPGAPDGHELASLLSFYWLITLYIETDVHLISILHVGQLLSLSFHLTLHFVR